MAKPAVRPDGWAATGALTTPTAGKLAAGWVPGERAAAQYFNWFMRWAGEWLKWLDTGTLDGNYTITGNLTVQGTFTHSDSVKQFCAVGDSFEGNNPSATSSTHTQNRGGWTFAASTTPIFYAVKGLRDGDTVTGYAINLVKTTNSGTTISSFFTSTDGTAADTNTTGDSTTATGTINLGPGDTVSVTVDATKSHYIKVTSNGVGSGDKISGLYVNVTRTKG